MQELGFIDQKNFVEDSTWYGMNRGYVIDVTTMNLSDDLVQSKCETMSDGQKPSLLIGAAKGAESGWLNEFLKSCVHAARETAQ